MCFSSSARGYQTAVFEGLQFISGGQVSFRVGTGDIPERPKVFHCSGTGSSPL